RTSQYDESLQLERLVIASRRFPRLNSFSVALRSFPEILTLTPGGMNSEKATPETLLVQAGQRCQMSLSGADTRMTLAVVPLKQGRRGDTIRVRLANTSKYFTARVVAKNLLEAVF